VVITDRRLADPVAGLPAILAAAPRGAVAVQVREKDLDGGPLHALVRAVIAIARPAGAAVWVNDRADVALAAGADGVHLPERGLAIDDIHGLAIGCSRHSADDALAAARAGASLVQLGPIWPTPGKDAPLGPGVLAIRRALPPTTRLVAVGGIDRPERAREAAAAGADAVAVIRAAWTGGDPARAIAALIAGVDAGLHDRS